MDILLWISGGILFAGVALALYEWRRGKTLLRHDLPQDRPLSQTERHAFEADVEKDNRSFPGDPT